MKNFLSRHFFVGVAAIVVALIISHLASDMFSGANSALLKQYYRVRGEQPLDSSIVILYFGNEDIAALGGYPLKRNYYALLVSALHEVGASAIGFDIAFINPDREHPEFDEVFATVVKSSGNVVMSGYFASFENDAQRSSPFPNGIKPELPFPQLRSGAVSIAHTNLGEQNTLPMFIHNGTEAIPALSLELLRVGLKLNKEDVTVRDATVSLLMKGTTRTVLCNDEGEILLNYSGGTKSLHTISALNFLQDFDEWKSADGQTRPPHPLQEKIVIVGIIAEGKSTFVQTPFDSQFPSIGIHAMAMHNILSGTTLSQSPALVEFSIVVLLGLLATWLMRKNVLTGLVSVIVLFALLIVLSYISFVSFSHVLPVTTSLFALILIAVGLMLQKQFQVQSKLTAFEIEKINAERILQEKEQHLTNLEAKLKSSLHEQSQQPSVALLQEINKYKEEIGKLQSQVADLNPTTGTVEQGEGTAENFHGIVYHSSGTMAEVVNFLKKIATTDASILILGESGTGKEMVANAIHLASNRKDSAFVAVNCGALTETLLESELFGHEKGAFTGAVKEKAGRFELANEGTIFLDEIAETSEAFQVKLLRVLQEGTFERVGGTQTRKVNVRVIAATNRDIKQEVKDKRFREDLFYRLNVFTVTLPALRERQTDIPFLVEHFLKSDASGMTLSATVSKILLQHEWKGNVRELQSVIKHAIVLAQADGRSFIRVKDLPKEFADTSFSTLDIEEQILELLRSKQFSRSAISETADELGGMNRGTVAEYFRGTCFKVFCESNWNIESAVAIISGTDDKVIQEKVRKKLVEYLSNAVELVDSTKTIEEILSQSKPKYKNLPQRHHQFLDLVITSNYQGKWNLLT
ncbi:MAG: sigma 54-interacting transcriptional regulator, partial [Ignavibacteriales bacterium]|nr:sigma 54-interacting transcriptional regulator [Ignavibacteriales bacterium]